VDYLRFIMEQNRACYFNAAGRYRDAEILCRKLLDLVHHHQRSRMMARTRCYLAQALFSQGKTAEAHDEIEMAGSIQVNERLYGDLATYSYPLQARLTEDDSAASNKFRRAVVILRKQVNPLGLARVLTVKARRLKTDEDKWEITQLIRTCDALKDCTLARRIVSNWEEWKEGLGPANGNDYGGM
jgi:tetratricopeptide (TPR) repeat protein